MIESDPADGVEFPEYGTPEVSRGTPRKSAGSWMRRGRTGSSALYGLIAPVAVEGGDEVGERLLSRRRLHDLRHSSASIQLTERLGITLVSKRLRNSNTSITRNLYVHLPRSKGRKAAETISAASPHATRVPRG